MKLSRPVKASWGVVLLLGLVVSTLCGPQALAAESAVRVVRGEVVAVTITETPQVIVVKVRGAGGHEMIVGATVDPDAKVMRRKKPASLSDVNVGEIVDLKYIKSVDGVIAKSVHVR